MGTAVHLDPRGNQKKGVEQRKKNTQERNDVLIKAITGGFDDYAKKLEELNKKNKLTKPEQEYMDRMEKIMEFAVPKLARKEVDITSKGDKIEGVVIIPEKK